MPGSEGRARKSVLKASNPPAEAPMATMGKPAPVTEAPEDFSEEFPFEGFSFFDGFSFCCAFAFPTRLRLLLFFGALGMDHPRSADSIEIAFIQVNFSPNPKWKHK